MCEYCNRIFCPPACPSYGSDEPLILNLLAICYECGRRIYQGEDFKVRGNSFLCGKCAALIKPVPKYV